MKGRILIVGAGGIGRRHIAAFLRAGWKVLACDTDPEKLRAAYKAFPLEGAFSNFSDVGITKYDAVLIATPAPWHVPMATRCAEEGVPFLVEKPLSANLEGVEQLMALSGGNPHPSSPTSSRSPIGWISRWWGKRAISGTSRRTESQAASCWPPTTPGGGRSWEGSRESFRFSTSIRPRSSGGS